MAPADPGAADAVDNSDQRDNTRLEDAPLTFKDSLPDLSAGPNDWSDFEPKTVVAGQVWFCYWAIDNLGLGAAGAFRVDVYASTNIVITTGDYLLGSVEVPGVAAEDVAWIDMVLESFPSAVPPGRYYVGIIIDAGGAVAESNEGNNTALDEAMLTVTAPPPDLCDSGDGASRIDPNTVQAGQEWRCAWGIHNQGDSAATSFYVDYYASPDGSITPSDYFLGRVYVSGVAAGATAQANLVRSFPGDIPAGIYYVGVIIDATNAVAEEDEGNNLGVDLDDYPLVVTGGAADLALDFGSSGAWFLTNGAAWQCGHPGDPNVMTAGDFDGNGRDDAAFSFGGAGTWIRYADGRWEFLHSAGAATMVAGDMNADGRCELVIGFAGGAGTWQFTPATRAWRSLHPLTPTAMACGDVDGNGRADVAMAFPSGGIWVWKNESAWQFLHAKPASILDAGDGDGDGQAELVVAFAAPNGLWTWANGGLWTSLHSLTPNTLALGDTSGDGRQDVVASFGAAGGLWEYCPWTRAWKLLHRTAVLSLAAADVDASGRADVIAGFADNNGTWILKNGTAWQHLHPQSPQAIIAMEMDGTKAAAAAAARLRSALAHDQALRALQRTIADAPNDAEHLLGPFAAVAPGEPRP